MTIVKTNIPFIVKDEVSGALLNTNTAALKAYKERRNVRAAKLNRIDTVEKQVLEIKSDINAFKQEHANSMNEMKNMLATIIEKQNG
jgi:hypothetical protein